MTSFKSKGPGRGKQAKVQNAAGPAQGPIGNTTGVYIPKPDPNLSGGTTKIPIVAETEEEKGFLEKKQEELQQAIDDWVASKGDSKAAMATGALATALNAVFFPTAWYEVIPAGKALKLVKKSKKAIDKLIDAEKAAEKLKAEEKAAARAKKAKDAEEAKKAQANSGGKVDPKKQKPHKDCGNFEKYNRQPKNNGLEKDHTPSGKALEKAARDKIAKRPDAADLDDDVIESILRSVVNNAPTIAVPKDVHSEGNTWRGKNTAERSTNDSKDLKGAVKRDTEAIQRSMDTKDHGCSEAYAKAAKKIVDYDFDKYIDDVIDKWLK